MGYSANRNSFWPDDDENTIYIKSNGGITSLADIIYIVQSKWPELSDLDSLESINISAENIHTDCLGYDLHDSSDYTNFIVTTKDA